MAYIKARGDQDTLHYVISAIGPPTVLVIMTQNTGNAVHEGISIDWNRLRSDNMTMREESITLSKDLKVLYSYGVVFTRVTTMYINMLRLFLKCCTLILQSCIYKGSYVYKYVVAVFKRIFPRSWKTKQDQN